MPMSVKEEIIKVVNITKLRFPTKHSLFSQHNWSTIFHLSVLNHMQKT